MIQTPDSYFRSLVLLGYMYAWPLYFVIAILFLIFQNVLIYCFRQMLIMTAPLILEQMFSNFALGEFSISIFAFNPIQ